MSMAWNFEVSPNPGVEALEAPAPVPIIRNYPSQPYVAVPGATYLPLQRGVLPNTYVVPTPRGPRVFTVVPIPR